MPIARALRLDVGKFKCSPNQYNPRRMPHHHWDDPDDTILNLVMSFRHIPLAEAPAACAWEVDDSSETLGMNFQEAEKPFLAEIEGCILSLGTEESLPEVSQEAAYFLGVRSGVLAPFVISLGISHGSPIKTVFLHPPDMSFAETAQWLLIDWWNTFGAAEATQQRIVDEYLL